MNKQHYTLHIKEHCAEITKRFEIHYTANRHQSLTEVIKKHSHYDESPYSIEAIVKQDTFTPFRGHGY